MKRIFLSISLCLLSLGLYAGQGSKTGTATVSHPPQFVTLNLWVKSQCYSTTADAREANDKITVEVQNILNHYKTQESEFDKIYFEGGLIEEYYSTIYENGSAKTICPNTFKKSSQITLVTGNLHQFSDIYSKIQTAILTKFNRNPGEGLALPVTFVTFDVPTADVCLEARQKMLEDANALATENANKLFAVRAKKCGIDLSQTKIVGVSDDVEPTHVSHRYEKASAFMSEPAAPQINFQNVTVSATVHVSYSFPDSAFQQCSLRQH